MLSSYLKQLAQISNRGDAREETYYTALNDLLGEYAKSTGRNTAHVTILPKQTEAGNPDFRVWDGKQHITGYIEAKDPSVENLDRIEDTEQLKRYLHTFPNLILTNFLEFRLYRNGELTDTVSIGRPVILRKLKTAPPLENEAKVQQLFEKFFSFSIPKVYDARSLAVELAKRTRFLKDEVIAQELREEEKTGKGFIRGFYKAFKDYLISGLTEGEFADLYAQTITYGLFAARTRSEGGFNRKLAYDNIPQTIGILREVFQFVSLGKLPAQMEWIIDDISEVLSVTDINKILHQYFHEGKGKDPIVHFYETFLSEYDPKTRKVRGVYYTPEPVVSYIVRSLHSILKEHFNRPDGFADRNVTVLDPAAGTLTFLAETAKLAVDEFVSKYGEGGKERFIKDHILKNFYAFEWMMAPYAIGHLKMSFLLEELGYVLQKDDRVKLYLTNTLEMEELSQTDLPGMASLSEESHLAGKVKKEQPILVILGNPPYSGHSSNIGEWISKEIRAYYQVDGKPLGEKNPKWLQDDYVKFLRFAQWKIDQAGEGVVGFITSHGYLDNPTFRGMRQSLMTTFDEIRILDLHGNSLKKERCHDGSEDKNVFDIQVGVAIVMFIKKKGMKKSVHHAELWGDREYKYSWLQTNDINTTDWKGLTPKSEGYFFIPRDESMAVVYERYWKVTEIFPLNGVGMTTARDEFAIDLQNSKLLNRIRLFKNCKGDDDELHSLFAINKKKGWSIRKSWNSLQKINDSDLQYFILPVLYRPYDIRNIFYHDSVVWRTVRKVMQHMRQENLGLIMPKRVETKIPWSHVLCTNSIVDHVTVSSKTIDYLFPLYLYPSAEKKDLLSHAVGTAKTVNISPKIMVALSAAFKKEPSPEEIFHYIYAVLYSSTYRTRYAEFLKTDFPRVPFTKEYKLFKKLSDYGKRLVDLHLLKSPALDSPIARLQGKGDNKVEKLKHDAKAGCVHINKTQFFEGVSEEVWAYQIGGYQVCDKWLKDRKGRELSLDEIQTYCRLATSIKKTIEIQRAIDEIYEEVEVAVI